MLCPASAPAIRRQDRSRGSRSGSASTGSSRRARPSFSLRPCTPAFATIPRACSTDWRNNSCCRDAVAGRKKLEACSRFPKRRHSKAFSLLCLLPVTGCALILRITVSSAHKFLTLHLRETYAFRGFLRTDRVSRWRQAQWSQRRDRSTPHRLWRRTPRCVCRWKACYCAEKSHERQP